MKIEPEALSGKEAYRLMISLIVPRPIAWITSVNQAGVVNAAPYSFFNGVSSKPPIISICAGRGKDGKKHTVQNIESTGEFVVNLVSEELAEVMNRTATEYPEGISEVEEIGLELASSSTVVVPRLKDSPASLECVLEQIVEIGDPPTSLILGEVKAYYLNDDILWDRENGVDLSALGLIGRLGGNQYLKLHNVFEMQRIPYTPPTPHTPLDNSV